MAPTIFRRRRFVKKSTSSIYEPSCAVLVPQLPVQNFMSPGGKPFLAEGGVTIPAIGTSATVVSFVVPRGQNGFVRRMGNVFVGGGFTDFSGSIVWQVLLDQVKNVVAPGFDNIIVGHQVSNPLNIDGIHIMEGATVALIVKNVSVTVAGQLIGGHLSGSFHPIPQEPPNLAF
jgi:hypothetical protein